MFNTDKINFFKKSNVVETENLINIINSRLKTISFSKKFLTFLDYKKPISSFIKNIIKLFILGNKNIIIHVVDIDKLFYLDFFKNYITIKDYKSNMKCDLSLPSDDLMFMFKYPWGSDTVNISGTANIFSKKGFLLFNFLQSNYKKFGLKIF